MSHTEAPTIDIVDDLREHPVTVAQDAADEIEALRLVVRILVDRFYDDTPMGPNVVDLPDVRWRILPPFAADAVKRALSNGSTDEATR